LPHPRDAREVGDGIERAMLQQRITLSKERSNRGGSCGSESRNDYKILTENDSQSGDVVIPLACPRPLDQLAAPLR
jgi:hypothetical protein